MVVPFGMLEPQVVVNLLPQLRVGVDLGNMTIAFGERFDVWRGAVLAKGFGGIVVP